MIHDFQTYTHQLWGKGFFMISYDIIDGWCELKRVNKDESISFVGDFLWYLKLDSWE